MAPGLGRSTSLVASALPAGDYLLVVDADFDVPGENSLAGPFTLSLALSAPDVAVNSACGNPEVLSFNQGMAQATSNTRDAGNAHSAQTCATTETAAGSDHVYSMALPASGAVNGTFTARVKVASQNAVEFRPTLAVRSACGADAGSELACSRATAITHYTARSVMQGLPPSSTFYVWVDSADTVAQAGPYQLDVLLGAAKSNESCTAPAALPLNTSVVSENLSALTTSPAPRSGTRARIACSPMTTAAAIWCTNSLPPRARTGSAWCPKAVWIPPSRS